MCCAIPSSVATADSMRGSRRLPLPGVPSGAPLGAPTTTHGGAEDDDEADEDEEDEDDEDDDEDDEDDEAFAFAALMALLSANAVGSESSWTAAATSAARRPAGPPPITANCVCVDKIHAR